MLPIAIVGGIIFHEPIARVQWLVPYLIFTMLLITFCRVKPHEFRIGKVVWQLLAVQILGAIALFYALQPLGLTYAQSAMICVLCPTATAAPVVTGMLGGSIARVASYSIVSNLATAIVAPALFVAANPESNVSIFTEIQTIAMRLAPMIVFPLGGAFLLYFCMPKVHHAIANVQGISFYLWAISLFLVVGKSISFVLSEPPTAIPLEIAMAVTAALLCVLQFWIGRKLGARGGDKISSAQGLGQKNTVLAIWMCLTYLDPLSSIGPAAYIIWQNSLNSLQLYLKMRREGKEN